MNSEFSANFGNWKVSYVALIATLLRRRKELRISQEVLAKQLKVGRRTFQRWEDGRVEPPAKRLFQWAAALGVSIAPHVAQVSVGEADVQRFAIGLREAGCSSASLPPEVLVHLMDADDKAAFIAWFEGRPNFDANDWSMLLLCLREVMPDLFAGRGAR